MAPSTAVPSGPVTVTLVSLPWAADTLRAPEVSTPVAPFFGEMLTEAFEVGDADPPPGALPPLLSCWFLSDAPALPPQAVAPSRTAPRASASRPLAVRRLRREAAPSG